MEPITGPWRTAILPETEDVSSPEASELGWPMRAMPYLAHAGRAEDHWYRARFARPEALPGRRILLRFGGAFYFARVWLNGHDLGEHEGYFEPFAFDVTGRLQDGDNLLAVRCRTPVAAGDFRRKTAVLGIFADWDCKPYPSAAYPGLPDRYRWTVPVGLWRTVRLETVDPVVVEAVTIQCHVPEPNWPDHPGQPGARTATVDALARLRNLTSVDRRCTVELRLARVGAGANEAEPVSTPVTLDVTLEAQAVVERRLQVEVENPHLWFPWTHGEPVLHEALLRWSSSATGEPVPPPFAEHRTRFGIRTVGASYSDSAWEWRVNGRRVFPRGSNYVSDFALDQVTGEGLRRDVQLARTAHLDLLRVHAHVGHPELYAACDELGMLVMCDFPLQWTQGHGLGPLEEDAFRASVLRQAESLVRLHGSRPSIALWSMHNEPPWSPSGAFLGGELHAARVNQGLDEAAAERVAELDPTRPVIPASGVFDQHLYHGWYTGSWEDKRHLRPVFPTEFGAQALPNLDSPVWSRLTTDWPVEPDDPTWAHAGYQALFWASPGIGPPEAFGSLADYIQESQSYQSFAIHYAIDQWRRQKFGPVGGYVHFLLTDAWPAITWSVLDYFRLQKLGYEALSHASRPQSVCLELYPGYALEGSHRLVYPEGAQLELGLWIVNDDYRVAGPSLLVWWIEPTEGGAGGAIGRAAARMSRRGTALPLPAADAPAVFVGPVRARLPRRGGFLFCAELRVAGHVVADRRLPFRVGPSAPQGRSVRRAPAFLVRRIYEQGSLRHTESGFTFRLRNPVMPVTLEGVARLSVDGANVDPAQMEIVSGGLRRGAGGITGLAPMEIPSGSAVNVLVEGHRLAPGPHDLEITVRFDAIGEVTAGIRDRLL